MKELTVRRVFRGAEYDIHIRQTGVRSVTINGAPGEGDILPLFPAGSRVCVHVTV